MNIGDKIRLRNNNTNSWYYKSELLYNHYGIVVAIKNEQLVIVDFYSDFDNKVVKYYMGVSIDNFAGRGVECYRVYGNNSETLIDYIEINLDKLAMKYE